MELLFDLFDHQNQLRTKLFSVLFMLSFFWTGIFFAQPFPTIFDHQLSWLGNLAQPAPIRSLLVMKFLTFDQQLPILSLPHFDKSLIP